MAYVHIGEIVRLFGDEHKTVTNPDSIPTLAQCWFNVVHYDGPWPAYNLGPV